MSGLLFAIWTTGAVAGMLASDLENSEAKGVGGTFRGRIESYVGAGENGSAEQALAQVVFKNVYDVLSSHPNATLVALQYGSGTFSGFTTGGGGGTDYYDGAAPFEDNAFFVFRMGSSGERSFDYYILGQWSGDHNMGNAPGDPATSTVSRDGMVGFQFAVGIGGDQNPWNGTTNADGTDTKGTPVWTAPGGGSRVHVFPLENRDGGTSGTNKELVFNSFATNANAPALTHHFVMDDDNVFFVHDVEENGAWEGMYFGLYEPREGSNPDRPLVLLRLGGTNDGYLSNNNEMGVLETEADGVKNYTIMRLDEGLTAVRQPNHTPSPGEFDEFPVNLILSEPQGLHYVGRTTATREVIGIATGEISADGSVFYCGPNGNAGSNFIGITIPWDGSTVGYTGAARAGVDFTRTP